MKLSGCIMCRNEVDRLERALRSLQFCDEIVVLDSGSTDGSVELAERLGARVIRTEWPGHTEQRRRLIAACSGEWVLTIDSDEWVPDALAAEIRAFLASPVATSASMPRRHIWLENTINHGRWYPDRRVRLLRRDLARVVGENPHDRLEASSPSPLQGEVTRSAGGGTPPHALANDLMHDPYRTLGEHLATLDRYTLAAAKTARRGPLLLDLGVRPPWHFFRAYVLERGFLDGIPGLVLAALGALYVVLKYARAHGLEPDVAKVRPGDRLHSGGET